MTDAAVSKPPPIVSNAWRSVSAVRLCGKGRSEPLQSDVAEEVPIAFRYNGFAHAVMMATPDDLIDFAYGFSLTEGIIDSLADMTRLQMHEAGDGIAIDMMLQADSLRCYLAGRRVRQLRGHTSCGICGAEDLPDIERPARRVQPGKPVSATAVERALDALRALQLLSRRTHGAHAAAWIGDDGVIRAMREDVGRHNALDKLIGAGLRGAFSPAGGFCLITSRCSFEMAQKAVAAGYGTLVAVAAPTGRAIRTAAAAGLSLFCLARGAEPILYTADCRVTGDLA
jgi:FdhD protein